MVVIYTILIIILYLYQYYRIDSYIFSIDQNFRFLIS